jgi:hypothetical protein
MTYVKSAFDSCITNNPDTRMTIYDIPSIVNTPLLTESFSSKYQTDFQISGMYLFSGDLFLKRKIHGSLRSR